MKIVHIVPGSGGTFYCENCMRDNALVKALRAMGHDVVMIPMYLPMFADDPGVSGDVPVFFGGINVYLQQKLALFRRTPRWLDRFVDARWILRLAARKAGTTRANGLGDMTLSMLRGADGNQAKELERLIEWLTRYERPDVVHLSNALLLGLAPRIRAALHVPVVCSLQDEDTWIDAMPEPDRTACWQAIAERAADATAFIAVSHYYRDLIRQRVQLPDVPLHVVHVGTEAEGHQPAALTGDPPVIGYLGRLTESQGLGLLVDAFIELKQSGEFPGLRLHVTGGKTRDNHRFIKSIQKRLARQGVNDAVSFLPEFDRPARLKFLSELTLLSVPAPEGGAFGTYVVEAMASGVPVVQPRLGAFPELLEKGGGGVLYEPNDARTLAGAIRSLLNNPRELQQHGREGRQAFLDHFTIERMAREVAAIYKSITDGAT